MSGIIDQSKKIIVGRHSRTCCVQNNVDPKLYEWDGKPPAEEQDDSECDPDESPSKVRVVEKAVPVRVVNVCEDMKQFADNLATANLNVRPADIWTQTRNEMDRLHSDTGWTGHQKHFITDRVRRIRSNLNHGDAFRSVENSHYALMTDSNRPFLQHHSCIPDRNEPGKWQRIMVFSNPSLTPKLEVADVDLYLDATFDCCPAPFYQCLIVMIFSREHSAYVPIMYILMTHKTQELYWHAFSQVVVLSNWKIKVRSFTSDFERAIINAATHQFPEGFHVGCLFHWKQAIRKHLISALKFDKSEIQFAMTIGVLDLLCIIPPGEVATHGIQYVRSIIEEDLDAKEIARWDLFWIYFNKQWMPLLNSWNICEEDGKYKKLMNRTNNGLESYNRRFNELFKKQPSLLEFVTIVEEESRYHRQRYVGLGFEYFEIKFEESKNRQKRAQTFCKQ